MELDKFNQSFNERFGRLINKEEAVIYKSGFNSGYNECKNRDKDFPTDSCLNCGIKMGFRGFCCKDCHNKHFRKQNGNRDRTSKKWHEFNSP